MSDDEEYYWDDDDDYYVDDGPTAQADDLAEHTCHSPIYIDWEPSLHPGEDLSDWEYYTDDFYDDFDAPPIKDAHVETASSAKEEGASKASNAGKRKRAGEAPARRKRRRVSSGGGDAPSPTPVVRWKDKEMEPRCLALVRDAYGSKGAGKRVALLQDWRERLGIPSWRSGTEEMDDDGGQATVDTKEEDGKEKTGGKEDGKEEKKRKRGARSPSPVLAPRAGNRATRKLAVEAAPKATRKGVARKKAKT